MKKILIYILIFVISPLLMAQNYEIHCAGMGGDGCYLVRVISYGKTVSAATNQALKDAVHGVLFRGFDGKLGECTAQKPIITEVSAEENHQKYFQEFFGNEGIYQRYAIIPHASNVRPTKVGKGYKVEAVVSVKKDLLRKEMEQAGIIKPLFSEF